MADLNAMILFAKVVDANGFSEAARRLGAPVSTVSRRIADLEDQLGVRLLERSTRSLRLTDAGAELLEHARRSATLSETVEGIASNQKAEVGGLLRLSAPPSVADSLVAPIVTAFQAENPAVRTQVFITERMVDHIAEGVDLVFRLGPLRDTSLVGQPILHYRHQLVATPEYLRRAKPVAVPDDLLDHRLLSFAHWKPQHNWTLESPVSGETRRLVFEPSVAMNDFSGIAAALLDHVGIGALPPVCRPELMQNGKLVEVLPQWRFRAADLSLVHLGNRQIPKVVRAFKTFATTMAPTLFRDLPC